MIYKSWKKRVRKGLANRRPTFDSNVVLMYNDSSKCSTFKLILAKEKISVRISTKPRNHVSIPLQIGKFHEMFLKAIQKGKIKVSDAKIILRKDDRIEFHLTVKRNVFTINPETILTVDVNERNITLVVFDKKTKREIFARIIDTCKIFEIDAIYIKIMRNLQKKLYKGHNPKYLPEWIKKIMKRRLKK